MARFLCIHTLPPGELTADQMRQMAQAAQQDEAVRGYRSFASLKEGKVACIMDAHDRDTLAAWFEKMQVPVDSITALELEGERGTIQAV